MSKRKKSDKKAHNKQHNTVDQLSVSAVDPLHKHDAAKNQNNSEKTEKEPESMPNIRERIVRWPLKLVGWWSNLGDPKNSNRILAVFTIVIAVTSILQWRAIKGQLGEMQDSSRPYIIPVTPRIAEQLPANFNQIRLTPAFINSGNSPALKITASKPRIAIDTDSGITQEIEKCSFTYGPIPDDAYLAPWGQNQIGHLIETVETRFIPDKERDDFILTGKEHIVLFGGIKYTGVRGGDCETTYCFRLNGRSLRDSNIAPWSPCSCARIR